MNHRFLPCALALALCATDVHAQPVPARSVDTAGVLAAHRAWWQAFATADTAQLRARSAPALQLTLSTGRVYDLAAAMAEVLTFPTGGNMRMAFADDRVVLLAGGAVVVSSHVTETIGPRANTFRFLAVLERAGAAWRTTVASSTRETVVTPRAFTATARELADFAGGYRTPRGLALRVVVRDSALGLVEPSGKELRMEPIAPGLFELTGQSPANGVVRLLFTRDASGRVTTLTQVISASITSFPRIP